MSSMLVKTWMNLQAKLWCYPYAINHQMPILGCRHIWVWSNICHSTLMPGCPPYTAIYIMCICMTSIPKYHSDHLDNFAQKSWKITHFFIYMFMKAWWSSFSFYSVCLFCCFVFIQFSTYIQIWQVFFEYFWVFSVLSSSLFT